MEEKNMAEMMNEHFVFDLTLAQKHESLQQLSRQYALGLERNAQLISAIESLEQQKAALERDIQSLSNAHSELGAKHLRMKQEVEAFESKPAAVKKRLDAEIVEREQRIEALKREEQELSNSISSKGAEFLALKEQRKQFVLEDIEP
jgi:predicted  nucleic acid-binding Zn-ribbon protein